jgi:hypothetical protein
MFHIQGVIHISPRIHENNSCCCFEGANVPSDSTDLSLSFTERELKILLDLSRELFTSETWPVTGPLEEISLRHFPSGTHSECKNELDVGSLQDETKPDSDEKIDQETLELERALAIAVVKVYNDKLRERFRRKRIVQEHGLINFHLHLAARYRYDSTLTHHVCERFFPRCSNFKSNAVYSKVCMGTWKCASESSSCRGTVTWASRRWRRLNFTAVTVSS